MKYVNHCLPWTNKEIAFLADNASEGMEYLVEKLRRKPASIRQKANRESIHIPGKQGTNAHCKSNKIDWDAITDEYKNGATLSGLAYKYNVHPSTISTYVKHRKREYKEWTPEEANRLRKLLTEFTIKKTAKLMGRSFYSVENKARKLGIIKKI